MKRLISSLISIAICVATLSAQQPKSSLKFNSTVHDFGQVLLQDGPVSHTFEATNVGSTEISIMSVTTSCGCTSVKWTHDSIKPGGKAKISATYTNDEGAYPFDKIITVKVVGENRPYLLHLRGIAQNEIRPDNEVYNNVFAGMIGMNQTELKCGNLEQGGVRSEQFTVANLSDRPVRLTFAAVSPGLKLKVTPELIPASAHATVDYTISAREDLWGYNFYSAIPVVNGVNSGKSFKIKAFTSGNFSSLTLEQKQQGSRPVFEEGTYSFGKKKAGAKFTASFTCENKGKSPLKVYKVDVDHDGAVPSELKELAPGKSGSFTIDVDTAGLPKGETLIVVTLTTNSPLRPIVTLFIAGIVD